MKKVFKKLAVMLSFVLVFAAMPMNVFAETSVGNLTDLQTALASEETNISITSTIEITSDVTLDITGKTISGGTHGKVFHVKAGGKLTVTGEGTIKGDNVIFWMGVKDTDEPGEDDIVLTIGTGVNVTSANDNCVLIYDGTLNTSGNLTSGSTQYAAIQGTGNNPNNDGINYGTTINVTGGAVECNGDTAIFNPQNGTVNISGGTVTGAVGVEMRAGTLNVTGGTILGTGTYSNAISNGSGSTVESGAAVVIAPHTTNQPLTANISGGTLTAEKTVAEVKPEPNNGIVPTVSISGGTHNGEVETTQTSGIITGGTFSVAPSENAVAPGYGSVSENGSFVVKVPGTAAESATHEHVWGYNAQFDAAAHWDYCHVCGAQNTPAAHSDADGNGVCDCGWVLTSAPSRVNPNTGVTAEMLK